MKKNNEYLNLIFNKIKKEIIDVDFDASMGMYDSYGYHHFFKTQENRANYAFFRNLYNLNKPLKIKSGENIKIPKIIHQIWIGPKPFPEQRKSFCKKWQQLHPDWEYRLWTNSDVSHFDFSLRDLYEEAVNYGQKSDLLRYEILRHYGGLYVDLDFECINSFEEFNKKYHFYAGLLPPHKSVIPNYPLEVAIALLGSSPNHPIIAECIKIIRERWTSINHSKEYNDNSKIFMSTMYPLRDAIINKSKYANFTNIVLPPTYFFPILPNSMKCVIDSSIDPSFSQIKEETVALHHWDGSWV